MRHQVVVACENRVFMPSSVPLDCSLPGLLQDLEDSKADLGITSYGLSVTTLEEVFLAVSAAASEEAKAKKQEADKLQHSDKPLEDSSSAAEIEIDEEILDPKADAQLPAEEQPPAEKPYTLIKVLFLWSRQTCCR